MKIFRNPEIQRQILISLAVCVISAVACFFINPVCALASFISAAAASAVSLIFSAARYKKISALADDIDKILHGCDDLRLEEYSEGEISILASEIYKMTVRIREQADALIKDKTFLADSIADISHQIKTPLTSMNLIISMLQSPDIPEAKRIELTRELSRLIARIQSLVAALLKMSRIDSGTANFAKDKIRVDYLIKKACAPLSIPMDLRGQRLITEVGEECFTGDLMWSAEALGNIIKNCMEHTPEGGEISVAVQENPLFTEISVSDTGTGISKADLPHIFERFYRGQNSSSESVGIGLALARMIVAEQDGTLKAENGKNGGAKFTIRFYKETI